MDPVVICQGDVEPPEHVPRTSARAHNMHRSVQAVPCVPRNREHGKRHAGGRAKNIVWNIVIQDFPTGSG